MSSEPISVIEIGTSHVVYLIGRPDKDGRISVIASGINDITGVRKGLITNFRNALTGVNTAVRKASRETDPNVNNWLVFSGGNASSNLVVHSVLVDGGTVTREAVDSALGGATGQSSQLGDRVPLHAIPQDYTIRQGNRERRVADAEQMRVDSLQANVLLVHCDRAALTDTHNLVEAAHLPIRGHIFSAVCAGRVVLTQDQRVDGTLLINLGGGTTSFALYSGGVVRIAASIPVGGDHVTYDLSRAFSIPTKAAELLKQNNASAVVGDARPDATVNVPSTGILDHERILNLAAVNTVVNARIDELFRIVFEYVGTSGYIQVVLVGGGAFLKGITSVAATVFGCPCTIGTIQDGTQFGESGELGPLYATAYGALHIAHDELEEDERKKKAKSGGLGGWLWGRGASK